MSDVRVMVHAVWGTKNRYPFLTPDIRKKVIDHIKKNAKTKGIYINRINGSVDHMHCLLGLDIETSIGKTMQLLKGESSFWINKEKLTPKKFEWADEYFMVGLCDNIIPSVRKYIDNQEEHHKKKTFAEEYEEFLKKLRSFDQG